MSSKNFNTLAIVTVVLIVVSILMSGKKSEIVVDFVRGQELISFLDVEALDRIEIEKGEEKVHTQKRLVQVADKREARYFVESRSSYPADIGRVNNAIDLCLKVKCMREISNSKDTHADLGVDEGNADALIVRFKSGDKDLISIIAGNESGKGQYVRRLGDDKVYLSDAVLRVSSDSLEYVDRALSKLDRERFQKVELLGNGQPIVISKTRDEKSKETKITLHGIPEGMMEQPGVSDRVLHVLSQLNFVDFMSGSDEAAKDLNFKFTYKCTLDSGELYTYKLAKKEDKWYGKAIAKYIGPKGLDPEEVKKFKDDEVKTRQFEATLQASAKIKKFNIRNQSWVYELDNWIAENMTKAFADLIEEEKDFLKISESAIHTVLVTPTEGQAYTIDSPKEGELKLLGVPETKNVKGDDYQLVFTAGSTLRWNSHKGFDAQEVKGLDFPASYKVTLRDGACYEFKCDTSDSGDKWVKASASYTGDGKDANAAVLAKAAIAQFNTRHAERIYSVYNIENLTRRFRTLVVDKDTKPEEVKVSHILIDYKGAESSDATRTKVDAKTLIESLHAQLVVDPAKFAELAKANSDCSSKDEGGALPKFKMNDKYAKEFKHASFALKVGEMSGVVESKFGFHIIKRTE